MGRPKGTRNRKWTDDEIVKYVLMCEEDVIPVKQIAREFGIPYGTLN